MNKNTGASHLQSLREIGARESEDAWPLFGEIEVYKSYFGGHRRGKHERLVAETIPVFGLLERCGKVYAKGMTVKASIGTQVLPHSMFNSDAIRSRNGRDVYGCKP